MAPTGRQRTADVMTSASASAVPSSRHLFGPTAVSPVPGARDPKLAERVAAAIEADVLRAGWPVGQMLGSEGRLASRYGVGRAVIREAIPLAEHRQVARMRRGRGGGLVVVKPDVSAVTESLAIYLEYAQVGLDDLMAARTVLEVFAATVAAASLDEEHVLALRQAAEADAGAPETVASQEVSRVHELIAETSGNAALSLFIQAIAFLSVRMTGSAPAQGEPPRATWAAIQPGHQAIVEAIAAGDELAARDRMREHMTALRQTTVPPDGAAEPDAAARSDGVFAPHRPADVVAARIRREIVSRGWPVGESLGFEGDLLRRYGIGRAQFREAIRILENHSVVRMQRGAAGGMVVTAPDGRAVVRAVSLYLTYQGMNTGHIRDLREELEAATVRLAIERLDAVGTAQLAAVVERERNWPDEDFPTVSHDLHPVIAELSGNRTLALLLSIVMQLSAERLHAGNPGRITEPPEAVRHAHQAIVEAIVARDAPLALRRMRKHLRALARWTVESSAPRP
jgi:DNA-binding FadR family transcriptional regulator